MFVSVPKMQPPCFHEGRLAAHAQLYPGAGVHTTEQLCGDSFDPLLFLMSNAPLGVAHVQSACAF